MQKFMAKKPKQYNERGSGEARVVTHKVEQIDIYEVTENELNLLEKGTDSDLYLQFSIALLSVFFSLTVCFFTSTFNDDKVLYAFVCVDSICFIIGALLLVLWYRNRKGKEEIIKGIKNRKKTTEQHIEASSVANE